jgi:hypothetical protein
LGNNRYRVWNLPFYVYNLDMRAIVECKPDPEGGLPIVVRVVEPGDCPIIRIFFDEKATDEQINSVLDLLSKRRALLEKGSREFWAVGFRSNEDYEWAGPALEPFASSGLLEFESAYQLDEPEIGATS